MNLLIDETYFLRWQGGRNYLKNIMLALKESGVILHRLKQRNASNETEFPFDFTHEEQYPKSYSWKRIWWKVNRDKAWELLNPWIKQIDASFQVANQDIQKRVKSIRWIPDFQHVEMPELFSKEEIDKRNQEFEKFANEYDRILVSSHHAQKLFNALYPFASEKSRVYQFRVTIPEEVYSISEEIIRKKYQLPEQYIHFPAQWWKHKNHQFIFEVMSEVNDSVKLICTGKEEDYRNPNYVGELKKFITENNLEQKVICIDEIPYSDMLAIMRFSNVVINPSSYEGWSTTVEEAKLFGKNLICLDTPLFREQAEGYNGIVCIAKDKKQWENELSQIRNERTVFKITKEEKKQNLLQSILS